jgi:hybrid polyketide synthase / nonribosomal peptide synthetase ACE1
VFLNGLAGQRRKRGLVGSVIATDAIIGVGYMSREVSQTALNRIKNLGYIIMFERDFHQLFAEAVLASTGGSNTNPEIVSGISVARYGEARPIT